MTDFPHTGESKSPSGRTPGLSKTTARAIAKLPAGRWSMPSDWEVIDLCSDLTSRQVEVIALHADGWSLPKIGTFLGISHRTAELHLVHALEKIGMDNRTLNRRIAFRFLDIMDTSHAA